MYVREATKQHSEDLYEHKINTILCIQMYVCKISILLKFNFSTRLYVHTRVDSLVKSLFPDIHFLHNSTYVKILFKIYYFFSNIDIGGWALVLKCALDLLAAVLLQQILRIYICAAVSFFLILLTITGKQRHVQKIAGNNKPMLISKNVYNFHIHKFTYMLKNQKSSQKNFRNTI